MGRMATGVAEFGLQRTLLCCGHAINPREPHHGFAAYTSRIALSTKEEGGCSDKNCSEYHRLANKDLGGIFQHCPGCYYRGALTDPFSKSQTCERRLRLSKCVYCGKRPENSTWPGSNSPSSAASFETPHGEQMVMRSEIRDAIFRQLEDQLLTEQAKQRACVEVSLQHIEMVARGGAMGTGGILFFFLPSRHNRLAAQLAVVVGTRSRPIDCRQNAKNTEHSDADKSTTACDLPIPVAPIPSHQFCVAICE